MKDKKLVSITEIDPSGQVTMCHHWDLNKKIHTIRHDDMDWEVIKQEEYDYLTIK